MCPGSCVCALPDTLRTNVAANSSKVSKYRSSRCLDVRCVQGVVSARSPSRYGRMSQLTFQKYPGQAFRICKLTPAFFCGLLQRSCACALLRIHKLALVSCVTEKAQDEILHCMLAQVSCANCFKGVVLARSFAFPKLAPMTRAVRKGQT